MARTLFLHQRSSAFICGLILFAGCEVTHDENSAARKEQQNALNDPFHYGPDAQKMQKTPNDEDIDPTDITGGGTSNLNKKLLKRDWDRVIGND
jgi:hypothetical protein